MVISCTEELQQIKPGDKVTVRLETDSDQVYRGHVQDVSPANGPICVFVEELGQRYDLPTLDAEILACSKRFPTFGIQR